MQNIHQVVSEHTDLFSVPTGQSFWRHRWDKTKPVDYLVRGDKIYRMGDGQVVWRIKSEKAMAAKIRWLEGARRTGRRMRVKVIS